MSLSTRRHYFGECEHAHKLRAKKLQCDVDQETALNNDSNTPVPKPSDIDAQWLSRVLQDGGYPNATVTSVTAKDVGTGQVGRCIRYSMQFDGATGSEVPRSLVAKFTSDDPVSRQTGKDMKTYLTETHFYREIAPKVQISVPRCYYANIDDEGLNHLILMEDMAPGEQGDQIAGCSVAIARQAVLELVGLHGPTWCDSRWFDLLGSSADGPFADTRTLFRTMLPEFGMRFAARLSEPHMSFINAIGQAEDCPMFNLINENFALEHYDYRLDNVLIDQTVEPARVTAVDWQSVRVGKPLNDVAYFLGSALEPEVRRMEEQAILKEYYAGLIDCGVTNYSFEQCFEDYRKGVFAGFAVTVIAAVVVQQTERGDEMFTTMARRYSQMALDLDAAEFIS